MILLLKSAKHRSLKYRDRVSARRDEVQYEGHLIMEIRRCGKIGVELSAKSQMGRASTASVETNVRRVII